MPAGHVAAPDPYPSREQRPRVYAGLKSWTPLVRGPVDIHRGPRPSCRVRTVHVEVVDPSTGAQTAYVGVRVPPTGFGLIAVVFGHFHPRGHVAAPNLSPSEERVPRPMASLEGSGPMGPLLSFSAHLPVTAWVSSSARGYR